MENAVLDSIKLKLPCNHLLNKLAKHVKENNRLEGLGGIISKLA